MRRHSPYNYAFNNPVYFIDPDGMAPEEVIINGSKADEATRQLNSSTSLSITRNSETGKLTATGEAKTRNDRKLLKAINDKNVKVNITADDSKTIASDNGNLLMVGGAFNGNTVSTETTTENGVTKTSKIVTTDQLVNPNVLGAMDAANSNNGSGMLHETLESYIGGKISLRKGSSSTPAGQNGSVYEKAHRRAPSQGAEVNATYWDSAGNILASPVGATNVEVKSKGVVIMVYP